MRRGKRSKINGQAWLFGLAVPGVALFMLFSLLPYDKMVGQWPLGIRQGEVMAFQELFDHRPGQHVEGHAEILSLNANGERSATLATEHAERQAAMQATGPGSFTLHFTSSSPDEAAAMAFVAADLPSLVVLYAQAVADSLPIMAPPVSLVKLQRDGRKGEPYLVQELVTPEYILKHAPVSMTLVGRDGTISPEDRSVPAPMDTIGKDNGTSPFRADRFDTSATAALGLLAIAEDREPLLRGQAGAMYDRVVGGITPLYAMKGAQADADAPQELQEAFRAAMGSVADQARIMRLAKQLHADSALWAQRLLAIDSAAVPVLAKGRNIGLVQAEVDRTRELFLQRLFHPEVERFIGQPAPVQAPRAVALDPWLAQFRSGKDTLRFVRGKYDIDHDLVVPAGMAIVLEKGTRWFMAPGVSVVVNGELHMRGTDVNPVFIRPQDAAAPWGCIAVNGTGRTRVRIQGLRISGGSDLLAEGVYHGGMLSFIGADVTIANSSMEEAFGAATVSVKRGTLHLSDSYFAAAHGSYVRLTEVKGAMERCGFGQPDRASATDGRAALSLRASQMQIKGCTVVDMPFTALRLGRGSKADMSGMRFTGNGTAIMALDGSSAQVVRSEFTGNKKVFVLRSEHPLLGGAEVKEEGNSYSSNGTFKEVDAASKLVGGGALAVEGQ
ncbi:MAG TPA: hypothetical protein PKD45_12545 [Flavobacteriales bacterium]|nr:hypothetical protein [Flavobacteriales bacterium]